jgi:sigma-B regulation protein RsbU (phosphoserine phosphatase)
MICGFDDDATTTLMNFLPEPRRRPAVLVSEDHDDVLAAIGLLLKSNGFDAEFVKSPTDALEALRRRTFDALLLDLNYSRDTTSGAEGLELLTKVQAIDSTVPIVVMTAWGTIELAVEAMHRGASDFVQKPWDNRRLLEVLEQQMERARKLRASRMQEQRELQEAAQIQRAMLPSRLSLPEGLEIAAVTQSVRNVSGDYYDVIRIDEHRTAICIADVMGKGVGAALVMSQLQATVRMLAPQIADPKELCNRLNKTIAAQDMSGRFITLFFGVIDMQKMRLTYTNAGHSWPILAGSDRTCEQLQTDDAVLGTFPGWNYHQDEINLSSGDRLLLFTDGITDCENAQGEEFGENELQRIASDNVHLSADALEHVILSRVQNHCGGAMNDDATLIVAAVS